MTPIVIRLKDVAVRVAAKRFKGRRVRAEVQLTFVDSEQGGITRVLAARSQSMNTKSPELRRKLRGVLVELSFVRL